MLLLRSVSSVARRRFAAAAVVPRALSTTTAASSEGGEKLTYRAETQSLLRIVSKALYTEREVFLRELVSNACDALEKVRMLRVAGEESGEEELRVRIKVDEAAGTLEVSDNGIGMSKAELVSNLGTIALSGSGKVREDAPAAELIGQFGVGFYSAFMVGDSVEVASVGLSGRGGRFVSSLEESYEVFDFSGPRGTTVTVRLKEDAKAEFCDLEKIRAIVSKYSKFARFPITVGETAVNTEALWTKKPAEATKAEYDAFYRSVFKAWDEPAFVEHFSADAPLDIKALLFFPSFHTETMGMARLEPSVSLYCRKVLVESPCRDLVPDWMRFVKGVVDSEDLPLSISREKSQDKMLLDKLKDVLVRKTLRFLRDRLEKDRDAYLKWYDSFGAFLKEGICHDHARRQDIAKLLFFDTSKRPEEKTSLDEFVSRLAPDSSEQEEEDFIYYLQAPSRDLALASPYYEAFKKRDKECLFVYATIDDFVMSNLGEFNGRKIRPAEAFQAPPDRQEHAPATSALTEWFAQTLDDRLEACELTANLVDSPAVVADAEHAAAMRRMMLLVNQQQQPNTAPLPKQKLLLNPDHPTIQALDDLKLHNHDLAATLAHQLLDNALVAAGLMDDARLMLPRLNKLLQLAARAATAAPPQEQPETSPESLGDLPPAGAPATPPPTTANTTASS